MRITGSLWRNFKGLHTRYRPLQGLIVMWVLFGVIFLLRPDMADEVRPALLRPLEAPFVILLILFAVDCVGQAVGWARYRMNRNG